MAKQPRKLNEGKLAIIKENLQIGVPLNRIAPCVGMTPTLLRKYIGSEEYDDAPWVQRLREVYHEATMKFIRTTLGVIYARAVGGGTVRTKTVGTMGDTIVRIRSLPPDAREAQWLLERRFPEHYARRVDDDADSYDPNEVVVLAVAGGPEGLSAACADHPFGKGRKDCKMAKQSRKLNKTTLAIIKESLQIGAPLNLVAPYVGMTPALLHRYIRSKEYDDDPRVRRLRKVYHEANLEFILTMLNVICKCAAGGGLVASLKIRNDGRVTVYHRSLPPDPRAAQWLLERRFPEYYARRVDDDADSYDPNEVVVLAIA